jgi:surfeit locus 1 family protein
MRWKEAILVQLAAAEHAPPVPLDTAVPQPWTRLLATGRFDHQHEAMLGAEVRGTRMGAQLVTPLLRDGQPPLLVLRGWVPLDRTQPITRQDGDVTVTGYVRAGEQAGWVAAKDDPVRRLFYTFDPAAIGQAMGLSPVLPFGLVVMGDAFGSQLPVPVTSLPQPENPHLGYALTWYGLALTLVGVVIAFTRRRWKEAK